MIISAVENGEIYVCAQSDDALDRPISSYNFATARFLHIMGVRFEVSDDLCYNYLLSGGETEPPADELNLPESPNTEEPPPIDRPEVIEGS